MAINKTVQNLREEVKHQKALIDKFEQILAESDRRRENAEKEADKLRANQKAPGQKYEISLRGVVGETLVQQFDINGISNHDAVFYVKHALANLEQRIRIS